LSKSKIKSCINKPVNILTLYSLPTLNSLCPRLEEEEDEEVTDEISRLLGHLGRQNRKQNIEKSVQKRAFTYKDWDEMLPSYFKYTLQLGQPPSFPQYTTWRSSKSRRQDSCWNPSL